MSSMKNTKGSYGCGQRSETLQVVTENLIKSRCFKSERTLHVHRHTELINQWSNQFFKKPLHEVYSSFLCQQEDNSFDVYMDTLPNVYTVPYIPEQFNRLFEALLRIKTVTTLQNNLRAVSYTHLDVYKRQHTHTHTHTETQGIYQKNM